MATITIVPVATVEAEAAMLGEMAPLSAAAGSWVVPVLDRGDLPRRVTRVLRDAGVSVHRADPGEDPAPPAPAPAAELPSRPAAVLTTPGVPADLAALAAALCGVPACDLGEAAGALGGATAPATALVLVDAETCEVRAVAAALAALAANGVRAGLIYAIDDVESRFAVLKTLLVDRRAGQGRASIVYGDREPRIDAGPAMLQHASSRERLHAPQDFLLVNGHANALDAALGTTLALCARAGADGSGDPGRAFPCFNDGRCFRQPLMGRDPGDLTGLLSVADMRASVLVLSGCNVAALGPAWFDVRHGLAWQAQQRDALACAVTGSVALGRVEFDLLFFALVAQGRPLGEVVAEVNRVRTEVHGHANAYPPGVGPFFLLGNPCLRVEGFECQDVDVAARDGVVVVDLDGVRFHPEQGAVVRGSLPDGGERPFLSLTSAPEAMWCRGIWYPGADGEALFLWLRPGAEGVPERARLELERSAEDPTAAVVTAVETCLSQVPLWTIALGAYRSRWGDFHEPPDPVDAGLAMLPEVVREFSQALTALTPTAGIVADARATRAAARALWNALNEVSLRLLDCLVAAVSRYGTLPLAGWEENLRRRERFGPLEACACGSPLWGQRYRYVDGGALERANYQCPGCGPVGEDDGRRLLRVVSLPREVAGGTDLEVPVECVAPAAEVVQVHAAAMIESLFRDRRLAGAAVSAVVSPGDVRTLSLTVPVPGTLPPGVYPMAVVAVLNGTSHLIRQLITVGSPRGTA